MTDTTLTDLGPFFDRYDRRNRLVCIAALSASLVLSAVILTHVLSVGAPAPKPVAIAVWGLGIVFPPLFNAWWWRFTEFMARGRRMSAPPDGRHPAGADDARPPMPMAAAVATA